MELSLFITKAQDATEIGLYRFCTVNSWKKTGDSGQWKLDIGQWTA
jgi:biotin synthase-like enzyme